MALPVDYGTVPVRGKYVQLDGTPATGQIRFTGRVVATSAATTTVILPKAITATLDANGQFTVNLPATDDPDITPSGWTYQVWEHLDGGDGRTFDLDVPLAAAGAGIDLSTVAPATPVTSSPTTAFVTLTAYQQGHDAFTETIYQMLGFMDNAIETASRSIDSTLTLASGRAELSYVTAYRTVTVTKVAAASRSTAATGVTGVRRGIYIVNANGSLTLVARTALIGSAYTAQWTEYADALDTAGGYPASYTFQKGQRYALGHFMTFTGTAPTMRGYATNAPGPLLFRSPIVAATMSGQSDLAASYTAPAVGAGNALYQYAF